LPLVVRTWNVFHGRTHPPSRRTHLRAMLDLVTRDEPDLVALQEVPLWALGRLERWTGMAVRWAVTVPALLVAPLARIATELDARRLRTLVSGQANVLLAGPRLELHSQRLLLLNPGVSRWDWLVRRGPQQRYLQAVEATADGRELLVANLHATNDPERAVPELTRAEEFLADADPCVLCGDFNVPLHAVAGFSDPIPGIDQILVRGLRFERPPAPWPEERRRVGGLVLSDHAPVEAALA
jgi:endonuclease/exonuclease/phosphatase family metal-dependent hydrolase